MKSVYLQICKWKYFNYSFLGYLFLDMNTQSISVNACLCADSDCKEWLSVGKIKVIHDGNGFKKWVLV